MSFGNKSDVHKHLTLKPASYLHKKADDHEQNNISQPEQAEQSLSNNPPAQREEQPSTRD